MNEEAPMPKIIVERTFEEAFTDGAIAKVMARMTACFETYNVTWVRSSLSADRKRMVCEYDAADAESVRMVQREAGASFDRAWAARVFGAT
jgi:hypothetical protein